LWLQISAPIRAWGPDQVDLETTAGASADARVLTENSTCIKDAEILFSG
jgi:hypothetical protein